MLFYKRFLFTISMPKNAIIIPNKGQANLCYIFALFGVGVVFSVCKEPGFALVVGWLNLFFWTHFLETFAGHFWTLDGRCGFLRLQESPVPHWWSVDWSLPPDNTYKHFLSWTTLAHDWKRVIETKSWSSSSSSPSLSLACTGALFTKQHTPNSSFQQDWCNELLRSHWVGSAWTRAGK